jgi:hypothetical protein
LGVGVDTGPKPVLDWGCWIPITWNPQSAARENSAQTLQPQCIGLFLDPTLPSLAKPNSGGPWPRPTPISNLRTGQLTREAWRHGPHQTRTRHPDRPTHHLEMRLDKWGRLPCPVAPRSSLPLPHLPVITLSRMLKCTPPFPAASPVMHTTRKAGSHHSSSTCLHVSPRPARDRSRAQSKR